jgi:DNA-binding transcriptional LysR family regulator
MEGGRIAEHLSVFVEVCRRGSFSAVARRRAVTHSSIVRQIDALETELRRQRLCRQPLTTIRVIELRLMLIGHHGIYFDSSGRAHTNFRVTTW